MRTDSVRWQEGSALHSLSTGRPSSAGVFQRTVQEHLSSQTYTHNARRCTNIYIRPQWLDTLQGFLQCLAGVHHFSVLRAADDLTPKLCSRRETQNSKEQKGGSKNHNVLKQIRKIELKQIFNLNVISWGSPVAWDAKIGKTVHSIPLNSHVVTLYIQVFGW